MHTRSAVLNETGQEGFIREPNWYQLKNLMLRVLSFTVSLWILSVYLISRLYASRKEQTALHKTGDMIRLCMTQDNDISYNFSGRICRNFGADHADQIPDAPARADSEGGSCS